VNILRAKMTKVFVDLGNVTTKFLDTHYADGYHGHQLTSDERQQLIGNLIVDCCCCCCCDVDFQKITKIEM
jgi:hypothetical protein